MRTNDMGRSLTGHSPVRGLDSGAVSLLDRITSLHVHDASRFRPFRVEGETIGRVKHDLAARLASTEGVFRVADDAVDLDDHLTEPAARTAAVGAVCRALADEG